MNIEFNKNEDINKQLVYELNTRLKRIYLGGGAKAAARQKEKGKMLARELVIRAQTRMTSTTRSSSATNFSQRLSYWELTCRIRSMLPSKVRPGKLSGILSVC